MAKIHSTGVKNPPITILANVARSLRLCSSVFILLFYLQLQLSKSGPPASSESTLTATATKPIHDHQEPY